MVRRLERAGRGREVSRFGHAGYIGAAAGVHCDAGAGTRIFAVAAQKSRIEESSSAGIELDHEGIPRAAAVNRLVSPGRSWKRARVRVPGKVRTAGPVQSHTTAIV